MYNESLGKPLQNIISDRSDATSDHYIKHYLSKNSQASRPISKENAQVNCKKPIEEFVNSDALNTELKVILMRQEKLFVKLRNQLDS